MSCLSGAGTFYAFANVERAIELLGVTDDNAFVEHLLNHAGVAVVPGSGRMRLSGLISAGRQLQNLIADFTTRMGAAGAAPAV